MNELVFRQNDGNKTIAPVSSLHPYSFVTATTPPLHHNNHSIILSISHTKFLNPIHISLHTKSTHQTNTPIQPSHPSITFNPSPTNPHQLCPVSLMLAWLTEESCCMNLESSKKGGRLRGQGSNLLGLEACGRVGGR